MEKEMEQPYANEEFKKAFDMGFESAVSLIEKSLRLSQDGPQYLIDSIEKRTFLSKSLREIVFKQAFN